MKSGLVWCLTVLLLCFSNVMFSSAGLKLEALHSEVSLLRTEITSVAAQQEIVMKTLDETIDKLDNLLVCSTTEQKDNIHIKPSKRSKAIGNNAYATSIKHLFEESVRTKHGLPKEKAAWEQNRETTVKMLKSEAERAITSRTKNIQSIAAPISAFESTANETGGMPEKLADDVRNLENKIVVLGKQVASNSRVVSEHQAVMEQSREHMKAEIMNGPYFQNSTLQLIAESFMSSINTYCDDKTRYTGNGNSDKCLKSFFHDLIELMPLKVRLVGGSRPSEGRVEILYNGAYGTVCDDEWDNREARVVCRMLGYSSGTAYGQNEYSFGPGTGKILLDDVECTGSEATLFDCPHDGIGNHNCGHNEDAGVRCS